MGLNQVTLVGRLTKDIELKYTNSGTAVTRFTLAVNRNYGNRVYVTEVVTDQVDMIDWANDKKTDENKAANRHNPQPNTDDPFQNDTIDIDDNDLPF